MLPINDDLSIDTGEIRFRFTPSSGPGGQHVNRSSTRVTLVFDVLHSASLTDAQRSRLLSRLASRLDHEGVLQIHVQDSRSQSENRDLALARFQALLAAALRERRPRRRTAPPDAAVAARLADKRRRALAKEARRPPDAAEAGE